MEIKPGAHLAVVRKWIQEHAINGEGVRWGSNEPLRLAHHLTSKDMDELAQRIADAIEAQPDRYGKRLQEALAALTEAPQLKVNKSTDLKYDGKSFLFAIEQEGSELWAIYQITKYEDGTEVKALKAARMNPVDAANCITEYLAEIFA